MSAIPGALKTRGCKRESKDQASHLHDTTCWMDREAARGHCTHHDKSKCPRRMMPATAVQDGRPWRRNSTQSKSNGLLVKLC